MNGFLACAVLLLTFPAWAAPCYAAPIRAAEAPSSAAGPGLGGSPKLPAPNSQVPFAAGEACEAVAAALAGMSDGTLSRSVGPLDQFDERSATSCVVTYAGETRQDGTQWAAERKLLDLFERLRWRRDDRYVGDGPDGTDYAWQANGVVCLVQVSWDGIDDSDPAYVPEDWFEIRVACAADSAVVRNK